MITYKELLQEMARHIGKPFSPIEHLIGYREKRYNDIKHLYGNDRTGLESYSDIDGDKHSVLTVDHDKKEVVHEMMMSTHEPTENFPIRHSIQHHVDRIKSTEKLPKGFATATTYTFWKNQELPIRSSDEQYETGHKMWHSLVAIALKDGKHVSHWDGTKFHQTTDENKEDHLTRSFGKHGKDDKHMVISHDMLANDE